MFEEYFGVDLKRARYFFGLTAAALLLVTLLYWLIFGFDRWSGQMQRASDLMTAAVGPPAVQANPGPAAAAFLPQPTRLRLGLETAQHTAPRARGVRSLSTASALGSGPRSSTARSCPASRHRPTAALARLRSRWQARRGSEPQLVEMYHSAVEQCTTHPCCPPLCSSQHALLQAF